MVNIWLINLPPNHLMERTLTFPGAQAELQASQVHGGLVAIYPLGGNGWIYQRLGNPQSMAGAFTWKVINIDGGWWWIFPWIFPSNLLYNLPLILWFHHPAPIFSAGNALVERFAPAGGWQIGKRRPFRSNQRTHFRKISVFKAVRATKSFSGYL